MALLRIAALLCLLLALAQAKSKFPACVAARKAYKDDACCGAGNGEAFCAATKTLDFDRLTGTSSKGTKLPTKYRGLVMDPNAPTYAAGGMPMLMTIYSESHETELMAVPTEAGFDWTLVKQLHMTMWDDDYKMAMYTSGVLEQPRSQYPDEYMKAMALMMRPKLEAMLNTTITWEGEGMPKHVTEERAVKFYMDYLAMPHIATYSAPQAGFGMSQEAAMILYGMMGPQGKDMLTMHCKGGDTMAEQVMALMQCPVFSLRNGDVNMNDPMTPVDLIRSPAATEVKMKTDPMGENCSAVTKSAYVTSFHPIMAGSMLVTFTPDGMVVVKNGVDEETGETDSYTMTYSLVHAEYDEDGLVTRAWFASGAHRMDPKLGCHVLADVVTMEFKERVAHYTVTSFIEDSDIEKAAAVSQEMIAKMIDPMKQMQKTPMDWTPVPMKGNKLVWPPFIMNEAPFQQYKWLKSDPQ